MFLQVSVGPSQQSLAKSPLSSPLSGLSFSPRIIEDIGSLPATGGRVPFRVILHVFSVLPLQKCRRFLFFVTPLAQPKQKTFRL